MFFFEYTATTEISPYWHTLSLHDALPIAKALAAGQRPSEQMFVIPARALQEANRNDEMFDMLALRVQAYPNPQTWNQTLRLLLGTTSGNKAMRSEEHTSELQSLMRISYAVFCLKKKKTQKTSQYRQQSAK